MDRDSVRFPEHPGSDVISDRVRAIVRGDPIALAAIVEWLTPLMAAWTESGLGPIGAWVDAEDVVQDVWVRVLPRLTALKPHPPDGTRYTPALLALLRRTLRNRVIDLRRQATRRRLAALSEEGEGADIETASSGPIGKLMRSERRQQVQVALGELTERDRSLYVRRVFERASLEELAAEFGMTRDAVIKSRQRTRKKLEAYLAPRLLDDLEGSVT